MDIPVYLVAGFLDAGKTEFINGENPPHLL